MCEARSRQFEVWQEKKMFTKRSEPIMLVPLFSSFTLCGLPYVAVVWKVVTRHHLLWLSSFFLHLRPASAFFTGLVCFYADPLHNQSSLESAMPRAPVIRGCGTNCIMFLCKHDGSAHIYIYIIQPLAQNQTAVIKISCLTMLGNKGGTLINNSTVQFCWYKMSRTKSGHRWGATSEWAKWSSYL